MLTRASRVAFNAMTNGGRFLLALAVMFVLTPMIISRAGVEDFALWSLTFSVLGVLGLLDMGFLTGVVKWVAECKGSGDVDRRNRMLSTVAVIYLVLALAALVAVAGFSLVYQRAFDISDAQIDKGISLLWILSFRMVILAMPLGLFLGILFGEQRIALINGAQSASMLVYGVTGWLALDHGMGIVTLAWLNLACMAAEYIAYIPLAYSRVRGLRLSWRLVDRSLLGEAFSFSMAQFLINVSALVRLRSDPIIVKSFLPLSAVGIYAIALRITESAYLLIKQFVNVLAPLIAELAGEGDDDKLRFVLLNAAKFVSAPAVMAATALWIMGEDAIVLWVGSEMADAAPVLTILLIALVLSIPALVAGTVLAMTGHHRIPARAAVISIVVNIGCSVVLVLPFGLEGIALGTLIATAVVDIGVVVRVACRIHGVSYLSYARRVLAPIFVPALLQAGVTFALWWHVPPQSLGVVVLEALPGAAIYVVVLWLWFVEPDEKRFVKDWRSRRGAPGSQ